MTPQDHIPHHRSTSYRRVNFFKTNLPTILNIKSPYISYLSACNYFRFVHKYNRNWFQMWWQKFSASLYLIVNFNKISICSETNQILKNCDRRKNILIRGIRSYNIFQLLLIFPGGSDFIKFYEIRESVVFRRY